VTFLLTAPFRRWRLRLLGLLLAPPLLAGTLYKSVGADGKIHYTDRPPTEGRIIRSLDFADEPAASARPTRGEAALIFTTPSCIYCQKAKAWLSAKGIRYRESNVETESGQRAYRHVAGSKTKFGAGTIFRPSHRTFTTLKLRWNS